MGGNMTPATILRDLQALGITLRAQGDKLRFHPRDAMTPELLAGIRDHKQDLLRLLTEPTPAPGCGSPGGDDHDTQALGCVGSTDAGPDETSCHEQQPPNHQPPLGGFFNPPSTPNRARLP